MVGRLPVADFVRVAGRGSVWETCAADLGCLDVMRLSGALLGPAPGDDAACHGRGCLDNSVLLKEQAEVCLRQEVLTDYLLMSLHLGRYAKRLAAAGANGTSRLRSCVGVLNAQPPVFGLCVPASCVADSDEGASVPLAARLAAQWLVLAHVCPGALSATGVLPTLQEEETGSLRRWRLFKAGILLSSSFSVVGYPKSGTTWLHIMLMVALAVANTTFAGTTRASAAQKPQLSPQSLLTDHVWFTPLIKLHGEDQHGHPWGLTEQQLLANLSASRAVGELFAPSWFRSVFLLRDPLDVLVSSFYHRKYRSAREPSAMDWRLPSEETLEDFATSSEAVGGLATQVAFLNAWVPAAQAARERVLLVSYEALHECPVHVLAQVLNGLLGLHVPCEALHLAAASTGLESLQEAARHSKANYSREDWESQAHIFRQGRVHEAHRELSAKAYRASRQTLSGLRPEVRAAFYETHKLCQVFHSAEDDLSTDDLVCTSKGTTPSTGKTSKSEQLIRFLFNFGLGQTKYQ